MNLDPKTLQKKLGVKIDPKYLHIALTHRSITNEDRDLENNERLEFLGDAVLELAVTEFLFETYPDLPEGVLTSFRSALVKTESLAFECLRMGINEYMIMSRGEEQSGGRKKTYLLANTFEAVIGAVYQTSGFNKTKDFIVKNVCYKIKDIVEQRKDIDAKSKLQEIAQEKFKITPSYKMLDASGPDHSKTFEMAVYIDDKEIGRGSGRSKQEAEQKAAKEALKQF